MLNKSNGTNQLALNAKSGKVLLKQVPSISDIAGKSKMTKKEVSKSLDKMREQG